MSNKPTSSDMAQVAGTKHGPLFDEYAIDSFDVRIVIWWLTSGAEQHPWRDKILFAAICTWTLSRGRLDLVRQAIIQKLVQIIVAKEKSLRLRQAEPKKDKFSHLDSLAAFWDPKLRLMFKRVYEPIGGFSAILSAKSEQVALNELISSATGAEHIVMLMTILHLHSTIKEPHHDKLTLQFAAELASELLKHLPDRESATPLTIRNAWKRHGASASLIYAASLRRIGGQSLLTRLVSSPPGFKKTRALAWFELARTIDRVLMRHCVFKLERAVDTFPRLRKVKLRPPELTLCNAKWLVEKFDDMEVSWSQVMKQVHCGTLGQNGRPAADTASHAACARCASFSGRFDRDRNPIMRP